MADTSTGRTLYFGGVVVLREIRAEGSRLDGGIRGQHFALTGGGMGGSAHGGRHGARAAMGSPGL